MDLSGPNSELLTSFCHQGSDLPLQDLMIVVGTSAVVTPAANYIDQARRRGATIVNVNIDAETDTELAKLTPQDFAFGQDAAKCLPELLAPIIGKLD